MFKNRVDAGRKLAQALEKYKDKNPVVLAIPRGGVLVAKQVADALGAPLDIIVTRKIGAPGNPEFALGAVDAQGRVTLSDDTLVVDEDYFSMEKERQVEEAKRRESIYRQGREAVPLEGKTVILVDDGIATGATVLAAVKSARSKNPEKVTLAVPVAPPGVLSKFKDEVDDLVILETPEFFAAVGQFYEEFGQVDDSEVMELLREGRR